MLTGLSRPSSDSAQRDDRFPYMYRTYLEVSPCPSTASYIPPRLFRSPLSLEAQAKLKLAKVTYKISTMDMA